MRRRGFAIFITVLLPFFMHTLLQPFFMRTLLQPFSNRTTLNLFPFYGTVNGNIFLSFTVLYIRSEWFDCTEPSLSTSLQGKKGVKDASALV